MAQWDPQSTWQNRRLLINTRSETDRTGTTRMLIQLVCHSLFLVRTVVSSLHSCNCSPETAPMKRLHMQQGQGYQNSSLCNSSRSALPAQRAATAVALQPRLRLRQAQRSSPCLGTSTLSGFGCLAAVRVVSIAVEAPTRPHGADSGQRSIMEIRGEKKA